MAIIPIFVFDDDDNEIQKTKDALAAIEAEGDVTIASKPYEFNIIEANSLDHCKAILETQRNLRCGGIVFFDVKWVKNIDISNIDEDLDKNDISFYLLKRLKKELNVETLPYAVVWMTAYDEEYRREIFDLQDETIKHEKLGHVYKRMNRENNSLKQQIKDILLKFEKEYVDLGGAWVRKSEKNKIHKSWLDSYQFEVEPIAFEEKASDYLKNIRGVNELQKPLDIIKVWKPNEIFAIEKILQGKKTNYIVYPAQKEQLPFLCEDIYFRKQGEKVSIEETWNDYYPTTDERANKLLDQLQREALPFLCIHKNFMISLTFYKETRNKQRFGENNPSYFPAKEWYNGEEGKLLAHNSGFAELRNEYKLKDGQTKLEYILCFPISGSANTAQNKSGETIEYNARKWQVRLLREIRRDREWYEGIQKYK